MRASYYENLLDRPSVDDGCHCAICGRLASNRHHVVQKGMGGVSAEVERRIPKMRLCGAGNLDGCHGLAHAKRLHLQWCESMGGWVYWVSPLPMDDQLAWNGHRRDYRPVPGWTRQKVWGEPIGGLKR